MHLPNQSTNSNKEIFNLEQVYLLIGDHFQEILVQVDVLSLDASASVHPENLVRMALITAFQFAEFLPDHLAADATLKRMDWKYALHLPAKFPGIASQALCQFRQSTFSSEKALCEFDRMLQILAEIGLYDRATTKDLNSAQVLSAVCMVSYFWNLNQAMKDALGFLVANHPEWLRVNVLPSWYERYKTGRLILPEKRSCQYLEEQAIRIGKDIRHLLNIIAEQDLDHLKKQSELRAVDRLFEEQFLNAGDHFRWQPVRCAPHANGFSNEKSNGCDQRNGLNRKRREA